MSPATPSSPRIRVESWAPAYAGQLGVPDDWVADGESGDSDVSVERAPEGWEPIACADARIPERPLAFIDGVRRVDAWGWRQGGEGSPDRRLLFGSAAAGAVRVDEQGARIATEDVIIRRVLVGEVGVGGTFDLDGLHYLHRPVTSAGVGHPGGSAEQLLDALQSEMRLMEKEVIRSVLGDAHEALVAMDGPRPPDLAFDHVVGYIKTHQRNHLPADLRLVVSDLAPRERTPVFLLKGSGVEKYSWYLRLPLAGGAGPTEGWHGVVRMEASPRMEPGEIADFADQVTSRICQFASVPHRDPRAPQNLMPIASLEHRLRHLLGDPLHVDRRIRRGLHGSVKAATSP